jgi:ATP-dependent DNA helicase DinG
MTIKITDIVEQVLGVNGIAFEGNSTLSRRVPQYEYAMASAKLLERGYGPQEIPEITSAICLEGSTGIGKSVAYLLPMLAYSALTGRRVAVATYTRYLQKQVINEDLPLVQGWIKRLLGVSLTAAARYGSNAYISYDRTQLNVEAIHNDKKLMSTLSNIEIDTLDDLLEWATICCEEDNKKFKIDVHTGLIEDFLQQKDIDVLPGNLKEQSISLNSSDPAIEKQLLTRDIEISRNVDILFVTHAMALINQRSYFKILDSDRKIRSITFDEADILPDVAKQIFADEIPIHKACSILASVNEDLNIFDHAIFELQDLRDYLATHQSLPSISLQQNPELLKELSIKLSAICQLMKQPANVCQSKIGNSSLPIETRETLNEVLLLRDSLERFQQNLSNNNSGSITSISWSPVRAFPSLCCSASNPSSLIARIWNKKGKGNYNEASNSIESVLFTSATIGVQNIKGVFLYDEFAKEVGIYVKFTENDNYYENLKLHRDLCLSLSPENFGEIYLLLADPSIPTPLIKDSENESVHEFVHNPIWQSYAAKMISYVHENPSKKITYNRTLVLCNSYYDVNQMKKLFGDNPHAIFHERNTYLKSYIKGFCNDPDAIFFTPSAWHGLSLPGTIANLVILRLPFKAPDSASENAFIYNLKKRGQSERNAKNILTSQKTNNGKRQLKQGFGRLVRIATDRGRIVICDSRFPIPSAVDYPALRKTFFSMPIEIPKSIKKFKSWGHSLDIRFRTQDGAYAKSQIFMKNGKINKRVHLSKVKKVR